jgi:ribosomal protein S18 acetylase RimI-like enzyme
LTESIGAKADIIPYAPDYAQTVRSWIDCEETFANVCRGTEFPPPGDIVDSWQREGVSPFLLFAESKPVAYAELWSRPMDMAVEIAHLIVDPSQRSKGYGTKMLELMFQRGSQRDSITRVLISLYGESTVALGCFLKARFELMGTATYTTGLKLVRLVE